MVHKDIHVPPAPAPAASGILRVGGNKIVDKDGNEVILKGAGLGGHLNMENSLLLNGRLVSESRYQTIQITGYPGHEQGVRRALKKVLGEEKYDYYFDRFLEYFFTEEDAKFFASLGLNCIRIPFNYRHFEDDSNPGVFLERGFLWLDRLINICAAQGIYTILDLHAAPGGQNIDWHCDTGVHRAFFWEYVEFQNRAIALWEKLAERYKDNTWVAGYNPLNEPTDEEHIRVLAWYEKAEKAIRKIDPHHILYWDGNTFAADFSYFREPLPNSVYAIHDYSTFGFPDGEVYNGTPEQQAKMKKSFDRKIQYHQKYGGPIWNGEFGPVYASPSDGPDWEETNKHRYLVLKDQLALYRKENISWSIWLYKDIGFQGMVYASPASAYIKLLAPFIAKKKRLAADEWGCDSSTVKHIFDPVEEWLLKEVPGIKQRYPPMWPTTTHLGRLLRNILLSEELYPEYAAYFKDLTFEQLDELAASFKFENCVQREGLNEVLRQHAN